MSGGKKADAAFGQAHVGLGGNHDMIAPHRNLTTTAQGVTVACAHHRLLKLPQRAGGLLKEADALIDFVPIFILNLSEQHQDVSAGGKMWTLIADDQADEVLADLLQ